MLNKWAGRLQHVAYGGGTDSTAMLIKMVEAGEQIEAITFADTGGEKPHTYEYIKIFSAWLVSKGYPAITVLKKDSIYSSLEDNCIKKNMLPSLAYGFKSCSDKYKRQPQDKWCNHHEPYKTVWQSGGKVIKCLGYDAGEERRAVIKDDPKYDFRYPLIDQGIEREECLEIIATAGLPLPGKSACFFCPASKKAEILDLADRYPDLMQRALRMEAAAELTSVKGLGRNFSWAAFLKARVVDATADGPVFEWGRPAPEDVSNAGIPEQSCGCYDG